MNSFTTLCRKFLLGVLLLLAFDPALWPQAQVGSVVGEIQVVRGDFPRHPVLVELQLHEATISSVYTDDQGRFGFYGLGSNLYHVIINDDSYQPVNEQANLNLLISSQVVVQVRLIPKTDDKKDPLAGRVKGSNPYLIDMKAYDRHFSKDVVKEYKKGVKADHQGKPDDAIGHYLKALSLAPDYYPAHNNLGCDYLSKADITSAQTQFEETIRLNQNDAEAYFNLGNVLILRQRYPEAEQMLQEGIRRRPDSALGEFLFGTLYSRTGKPADAERHLQQAVKIDPLMSQARLQLVNLYLQERRTPDAIRELESYLSAFPDAPFAPRARETLKKLQGNSSAQAPH